MGFLKFALIFIFSLLCFLNQASAAEILKIGGCGSSLGTMKHLAAAFEKKHPEIRVKVLSSLGSLGGVKAVAKGGVDIGVTGRELDRDEQKLGLSVTGYSRTPVIFITKKNIPVSGINDGDLIKIFKGTMQNWPNGERIRPILRQPSESNAIIVRSISEEISKAMDIAMSRDWRIVALTDQETVDLAETTPGAFSFSTLTQIISEKRKVNVLNYKNLPPSIKGRANKDYPLFKTHFMITKPNPSDTVKQFVDFVKSHEGTKIITESGNLVEDQ